MRNQLPLTLAKAITIHKSLEGQSLSSVVFDAEGVFEKGMAYVAISRAKTFEGLHIIAANSVLPLTQFVKNDFISREYQRLQRD